jgi:hypothetical protein
LPGKSRWQGKQGKLAKLGKFDKFLARQASFFLVGLFLLKKIFLTFLMSIVPLFNTKS